MVFNKNGYTLNYKYLKVYALFKLVTMKSFTKKIYTLIALAFLFSCNKDDGDNNQEVPEAFITVWELTPEELTVQLPIYLGTSEDVTIYDFKVDWGDGSAESTVTSFDDSDAQHTYETEGLKEITITGTLRGFSFQQNPVSNNLLINVAQWGDVRLGNAGGTFRECRNLNGFTATDAPVLEQVTNLEGMFLEANSFNGDLSSWDISNITNMRFMFFVATSFNQDLSGWDVSNVTTMVAMFDSAASFNADISDWNVSNVTDMCFMFTNAISFNQDLSGWATNEVMSCTDFSVGSGLEEVHLPTQGSCFNN